MGGSVGLGPNCGSAAQLRVCEVWGPVVGRVWDMGGVCGVCGGCRVWGSIVGYGVCVGR